ncbi:hypothetical protein EON65_16855 [archaeon]|nr:MAG: hypothetical protein EON65_16855 [archaeon]
MDGVLEQGGVRSRHGVSLRIVLVPPLVCLSDWLCLYMYLQGVSMLAPVRGTSLPAIALFQRTSPSTSLYKHYSLH